MELRNTIKKDTHFLKSVVKNNAKEKISAISIFLMQAEKAGI